MIGFLTVFVAASLAFALVVQGFYKPQPLFEKARFVDEILGGVLGLSRRRHPRRGRHHPRLVLPPPGHRRRTRDELPFLRDLWDAPRQLGHRRGRSATTLIPAFFALFGFLVPDNIEAHVPGQRPT